MAENKGLDLSLLNYKKENINQKLLKNESERFNFFDEEYGEYWIENKPKWSKEQIEYLKFVSEKSAADTTDINQSSLKEYEEYKKQRPFGGPSSDKLDRAFRNTYFISKDKKTKSHPKIDWRKITEPYFKDGFDTKMAYQIIDFYNFIYTISKEVSLILLHNLTIAKSNKIIDFDEWKSNVPAQGSEAHTETKLLNDGKVKGIGMYMVLGQHGFDEKTSEFIYNAGISTNGSLINTLVHEYGHAFDIYELLKASNYLENWNILSFDSLDSYKEVEDGANYYLWYKNMVEGSGLQNVKYEGNPKNNEAANAVANRTLTDPKAKNLIDLKGRFKDFIKTKLKLDNQDDNFINAVLFLIVGSNYSIDPDLSETLAESFAKWYLASEKTWSWGLINEFFNKEFKKIKK